MNSNPPNPLHFHRRKTDIFSDEESVMGFPHTRQQQKREGDDQNGSEKDKSQSPHHDEKKGDPNKEGKEDNDKDNNKDDEKKLMSPQKKRLLVIIAILITLIIITGGVLYWLHARHFETTDDAFVDGYMSQIAPRVGGQITNLLIVDNQHVDEGQLIAEIDSRDYEIALAQAKAQYAQAVAQKDLQQANVAQAEANVVVADADLFQATRDLKRFQSVDPKAITHQQLDNAVAAAKSAQAKYDASAEAVNAAKAQEEAADANVQQAETTISNAKLQLSYTKITAPIAGRITRRTVDVGNVVSIGLPLLAIVSDNLWVTANYKETQLDHMKTGQHVQIKIDAFPEVTFSGHVDSFQKGSGAVFSTLPAENATGNYVKVVQRIPVKIVFDDQEQRDKYPLAPGLSVDPRVTVR